MVQRSLSAIRVVQAIDKARNSNQSLTIKQATARLGISESSYYKMKAGKRSGEGSIRKRLLAKTPAGGVENVFTVQYQSGDRHASMTIATPDGSTVLDAFSLENDPKTGRAIKRKLLAEEKATGKHYWRRAEISRLKVTTVHKTRRPETNPYFVKI